MAEDLTLQLLSLQQSGTRQLAQIAVMRRQHQMDMAVVDMIDEVTSKAPAPPAPGTGRIVDRRA